MSCSFLLLLLVVVALALTSTSEARSDLAALRRLVPSRPVAVAAPLVAPVVGALYGCYFSTYNELQCPVGATIQVNVKGVAASATVTVGDYACSGVRINATFTSLTCTLPTSIQSSDYGVLLPVTVTSSGESSAPFGGVAMLQQPVLPSVTSISGCVGGDGDTATACRTGQTLTIAGTGFYSAPVSVSIGSYTNTKARYNGYGIVITVPDIAPAHLNTPLPVTVSVNGYTSTYTAGLSSYGALSLDSISGCASGSATACVKGDVITLTGSGFNLGPAGDVNSLWLRGFDGPFDVVSNTAIHITLPTPFFTYSLMLSLSAGGGMLPVTTKSYTVSYTPVFLLYTTFPSVSGCARDPQSGVPSCKPGDILLSGVYGGPPPSSVQSITIVSPSSGNEYNCGSLYLNGTSIACTVPQVGAVDLGQVLAVKATAGDATTLPYERGLIVPRQ